MLHSIARIIEGRPLASPHVELEFIQPELAAYD